MIYIKTEEEISIMREVGKYHAEMVDRVKAGIKIGVSTYELDQIAFGFCRKHDIIPLQIGYYEYPSTTCIGINDDAEHCIPSKEKILRDGDIMTFDSTIKKNGFCADAAFTVPIGDVDQEGLRLIEITKRALNAAIRASVPGNKVGDIGHAIHSIAKKAGYDTLENFVAHGIGEEMHEEPEIPNCGEPHTGVRLKERMTLALDTMICEGEGKVRFLNDGWSTKTIDGKRFGLFEHTVVVRKGEAEVLTRK